MWAPLKINKIQVKSHAVSPSKLFTNVKDFFLKSSFFLVIFKVYWREMRPQVNLSIICARQMFEFNWRLVMVRKLDVAAFATGLSKTFEMHFPNHKHHGLLIL